MLVVVVGQGLVSNDGREGSAWPGPQVHEQCGVWLQLC
jgi:hypothetical protein